MRMEKILIELNISFFKILFKYIILNSMNNEIIWNEIKQSND